jgi:toxin HigB-1
MIKSWKHKGLKRFYETGKTTGVQVTHKKRLKIILQLLDRASCAEDMNLWNLNFHSLKGQLKGYYSVKVNGNWRIIFTFKEGNAELVDYLDYH